MKLLLYKILSSNILLIYSISAYSALKNEPIQSWMKKEGYIVLSVPVKIYELDPTKAINAHTKFALPLIFEPLISINAQQELQPALAKSWLISTDNKSIVVSIKKNHRFSDKSEVTSQDIVNSIYRLCSPTSRGSVELKGLAGCEEHAKGKKISPQIYAVGKYEVKFNITASPTTFLYQLSSPSTVITKLAKKGLIGSGPYTIKKQNEGSIILEKNRFHSSDMVINNKGLILFYTSSYNVLSMLTKERPDGAIMYRMKELSGFHDNGFKLIKSNPNIAEILVLNNQVFPFNKKIVRKALSSAIYNNFNHLCIAGTHKAFGVIPTGIGGSIANMPPNSLHEISPEEIFNQVPELKNKKTSVTIHQLYDVKNDCESEQINILAKKYNIEIRFKYHKSYPELLASEFNHSLDGFIDLYILKNREAYSLLRYFTKNGENYANLQSTNIDDMVNAAISAPSSHSRFQTYRKIAQYIQDESVIIPIFYMDHGNLMNKCLTGISIDFFFNPYVYLPQISKIDNCKN